MYFPNQRLRQLNLLSKYNTMYLSDMDVSVQDNILEKLVQHNIGKMLKKVQNDKMIYFKQ